MRADLLGRRGDTVRVADVDRHQPDIGKLLERPDVLVHAGIHRVAGGDQQAGCRRADAGGSASDEYVAQVGPGHDHSKR